MENPDGEHAQFYMRHCEPVFKEITGALKNIESDLKLALSHLEKLNGVVENHGRFISAWRVHAWWLGSIGAVMVTVGAALLSRLWS